MFQAGKRQLKTGVEEGQSEKLRMNCKNHDTSTHRKKRPPLL